MVLLEALASGCRVVATDLPGCREILGAGDPNLVELLPLPPLKGVDLPHAEDEPRLEAMLAQYLERQVGRIMASPNPDPAAAARLTLPYSWAIGYCQDHRGLPGSAFLIDKAEVIQ